MKFYRSFIYGLKLCLLALWIACSQGPGDLQVQTLANSESEQKTDSLQSINLNEKINNFTINCPEGVNCPNYIGLVVAADSKRTWRCSGFLIDNETLMTAEHCLPEDLKELHRTCDGRLFLKLPKIADQEEAETLECDKVIGFESIAWRAYDFVVIKLKGASTRTLYPRLNFENRFHGQAISIWKTDHLSDEQSIIAKTNCTLNNRSLLSLYFQDPRSSQIQYGGCETNAGNSGAPVLNAQNEIIGIHSSSTKETSPISSILADLIPNGRAQEFSAATNLGCLCQQETSEGRIWRSCPQYNSCLTPATTDNLYLNRLSLLDRATKNLSFPLLDQKRRELTADPHSPFEWQTHLSFQETRVNDETKFQLLLTLKPVCLKRSIDPNTLTGVSPSFSEVPLCKARAILNGQFEIMTIGPLQTSECQRVNLELVRTNNQYLDYRGLYFKSDGTRSDMSPMTEVFSLPYCR